MDSKEIAEIISFLRESDVTHFELERDGTVIKLTRDPAVGSGGQLHLSPAPATSIAPPAVARGGTGEVAVDDGLVKVESPIVGTFYRKPAPDAELFVNEGDIVQQGDTLCIVEAMKLMNEIEAPSAGKVVKVLLQDGQVVEFGETLFLIDPNV